MAAGSSKWEPERVSSELFTLTYGVLVSQLLKDYENIEDVHRQLERMGYNIGTKIIEDFLAHTSTPRCKNFRDLADKIQLAFQVYFGQNPRIGNWNDKLNEFSLRFESNPLADFVALPDHCANLNYSNILTGVIRGACEMVQIEVASWFTQDQLRGDKVTELRIKFIKRLENALPAGED